MATLFLRIYAENVSWIKKIPLGSEWKNREFLRQWYSKTEMCTLVYIYLFLHKN